MSSRKNREAVLPIFFAGRVAILFRAKRRCIAVLALLFGAIAVGGCAFTGLNTGGTVGTTLGGQQDIASARTVIESGSIPDPAAITVEGFLSEHDIPIPAPEGVEGTFFPNMAVAWRQPFGKSAPQADVFIGIGTTIDVDAFQREPLDLAIVIDRSGSMDGVASATDARTKMDAVKDALGGLLDQLNGDDRIAIVSFSTTPRLELPSTPADERSRIESIIDRLQPDGSTNIEDAMQTGFSQIAVPDSEDRSRRLILFTDAMPNVGVTGSDGFLDILAEQAARGVGFTLMGVGYNFGTELAYDISQLRGGNSFFLADAERIATVFDEDFEFLVTPAAYDLTIDYVVPEGIGVAQVYGVPDYEPGTNGARIFVPTLFLSRREGGGAVIVRLTFETDPTFDEAIIIGEVAVSYTLADGTFSQSEFAMSLPAGLSPDGTTAYFSDAAARRGALLLDTSLAIFDAADDAVESRGRTAVGNLAAFLDYFDAASRGMPDRTDATSRGLSDERDLLENLLGNIQSCVSFGCRSFGGFYR